jgi:hypothetical protein
MDMEQTSSLKNLKVFLNVFGVAMVLLFAPLFTLTAIDSPLVQDGGALRMMRWDVLAKHVEMMLELIYLVWGIFMLMAARKPLAYLSFLRFTLWANLAHGLLMIPQAFMVGMLHKIPTDSGFCIGLAVGLWILLPKGEEGSN